MEVGLSFLRIIGVGRNQMHALQGMAEEKRRWTHAGVSDGRREQRRRKRDEGVEKKKRRRKVTLERKKNYRLTPHILSIFNSISSRRLLPPPRNGLSCRSRAQERDSGSTRRADGLVVRG